MANISVIENLSSEDLNKLVYTLMKITGITNPKELVRSMLSHEWALSHAITITSESLLFEDALSIEVCDPVYPKKFFSKNEDIVLDQKLLELHTSNDVCANTTISLSKYSLKKVTLDCILLDDLPEESTFEICVFWQTLIAFLTKQPKGKLGYLNEVVSNIFYLWDTSRGTRYAVQVSRSGLYAKWNISRYGIRDTSGWGEGDIIFTPA
jgi:hypothetical protein